jgi:hypothetical protein
LYMYLGGISELHIVCTSFLGGEILYSSGNNFMVMHAFDS